MDYLTRLSEDKATQDLYLAYFAGLSEEEQARDLTAGLIRLARETLKMQQDEIDRLRAAKRRELESQLERAKNWAERTRRDLQAYTTRE